MLNWSEEGELGVGVELSDGTKVLLKTRSAEAQQDILRQMTTSAQDLAAAVFAPQLADHQQQQQHGEEQTETPANGPAAVVDGDEPPSQQPVQSIDGVDEPLPPPPPPVGYFGMHPPVAPPSVVPAEALGATPELTGGCRVLCADGDVKVMPGTSREALQQEAGWLTSGQLVAVTADDLAAAIAKEDGTVAISTVANAVADGAITGGSGLALLGGGRRACLREATVQEAALFVVRMRLLRGTMMLASRNPQVVAQAGQSLGSLPRSGELAVDVLEAALQLRELLDQHLAAVEQNLLPCTALPIAVLRHIPQVLRIGLFSELRRNYSSQETNELIEQRDAGQARGF